jgi:hypothetical protein
VATTTSYLSFERLGGEGFDGLIRFDGARPERAAGGSWVADLDLGRRIASPGADGPQAIDEKTARELARRYGVDLERMISASSRTLSRGVF